MNEIITIKDTMIKFIGEYHSTTPQSVSIHLSGVDSATSVSALANIQYGVGSLDIVWIASAILFIVGFVGVIGFLRAILVAIVR